MRNADDDLKSLIAKIEKRGYTVTLAKERFIPKTYPVDQEQLAVINRLRGKLGLTMKEVLLEAFDLWIERRDTSKY